MAETVGSRGTNDLSNIWGKVGWEVQAILDDTPEN